MVFNPDNKSFNRHGGGMSGPGKGLTKDKALDKRSGKLL